MKKEELGNNPEAIDKLCIIIQDLMKLLSIVLSVKTADKHILCMKKLSLDKVAIITHNIECIVTESVLGLPNIEIDKFDDALDIMKSMSRYLLDCVNKGMVDDVINERYNNSGELSGKCIDLLMSISDYYTILEENKSIIVKYSEYRKSGEFVNKLDKLDNESIEFIVSFYITIKTIYNNAIQISNLTDRIYSIIVE